MALSAQMLHGVSRCRTDLEMSSGDLPDRERRERPVSLCRAENRNFPSVSISRSLLTKPLHMLHTPSYKRTGRLSSAKTVRAISSSPVVSVVSSATSRGADCCCAIGRCVTGEEALIVFPTSLFLQTGLDAMLKLATFLASMATVDSIRTTALLTPVVCRTPPERHMVSIWVKLCTPSTIYTS